MQFEIEIASAFLRLKSRRTEPRSRPRALPSPHLAQETNSSGFSRRPTQYICDVSSTNITLPPQPPALAYLPNHFVVSAATDSADMTSYTLLLSIVVAAAVGFVSATSTRFSCRNPKACPVHINCTYGEVIDKLDCCYKCALAPGKQCNEQKDHPDYGQCGRGLNCSDDGICQGKKTGDFAFVCSLRMHVSLGPRSLLLLLPLPPAPRRRPAAAAATCRHRACYLSSSQRI